MSRGVRTKLYMWLVIIAGLAVWLFSSYKFVSLTPGQVDWRVLLVALITVVLGPYLIVRIPRLTSQITVSDTFIFLTMLLYGGEAAILLAALEALCSSLRFSRKPITILFNSSVMACSTFLTVWVLRFSFGSLLELPRNGYSGTFLIALCVMALVQYITNSGLVAVAAALRLEKPIWQTWTSHYLWTSITYFGGASAAGIISRLVNVVGFYAIIVVTPIIAIIFLTYRTYRRNIETSAAQTEQAQRHADELSLYIAGRQRAEEERDRLLVREQEARAEAEAANRLKDEFLAMVSHELRTPLTPILGWIQMLREEEVDKTTLAMALESSERAAKAQERIINDLLDVSRIVRDKLHLEIKQTNLISVIEAALEIVRPGAESKDILIQCTYDSSAAQIFGDGGRLKQVVWNLLANAVKFTPVGGRIEVELKRVAAYAQIQVSDSGMGISADFLPHVFEQFSQADVSTTKGLGGLGLGLTITRRLVELHDGTIRVDSPGLGQGATFTVSLPITTKRNQVPDHSLAGWTVSEAGGFAIGKALEDVAI